MELNVKKYIFLIWKDESVLNKLTECQCLFLKHNLLFLLSNAVQLPDYASLYWILRFLDLNPSTASVASRCRDGFTVT